MNNSCKLVYQQQTYSIIYNDAEYTLDYIQDDTEWTNMSLTDSDGNKVDDDELFDALMEVYYNE